MRMRRFFVPVKKVGKVFILVMVVTFFSLAIMFLSAEVFSRVYIQRHNLNPTALRYQVQAVNQIPRSFFQARVAPYGKLAPLAKVQLKTVDYEVEYLTNQFGYRDAEWTDKPIEGKTRILVLGDSFTFGEGVNYGERYTEIAESKIENSELINTGIPGFGLDEMLLFYLSEGWRYQPQVVLLALNWVSMERNYLELYQNGQIITEPSIVKSGGQFGQTLRLGLNTDGLPTELPFVEQSAFMGLLDHALLQRRLVKKAELFEIWRHWGEGEPPVESEAEIEKRAVAMIDRLATEVKSHNSQLVIVILEPHRSMDFVAEAFPHLPIINIQPKLAALAQTQPIAFSFDPHFNTHTHQKIGEWLSTDLSPIVASVAANGNFVR
jgi:hypothetical protein